jgi:hypothetical protein
MVQDEGHLRFEGVDLGRRMSAMGRFLPVRFAEEIVEIRQKPAFRAVPIMMVATEGD